MTIKEVIKNGAEKLKQNNIEDAFNICKILFAHTFGVSKEYLIIHDNDEISKKIIEEFNNNINKIADGFPLQYITNNQEFMKMNFYVNKDVLIPQPDTEILVEEVLRICNNYSKENINILDLCTGSGAIAISIAKNILNAKVTATDISEKAINIAKINAKNNGANINFIKSDLFKDINDTYDIIVSNPPYIQRNIINQLPKDVQYEPKIALDGGADGLEFYRNIIYNAYKFINDNGYLALEIGYNQKDDVINILKETNQYDGITCIKDYAGNDRVIIAKKY